MGPADDLATKTCIDVRASIRLVDGLATKTYTDIRNTIKTNSLGGYTAYIIIYTIKNYVDCLSCRYASFIFFLKRADHSVLRNRSRLNASAFISKHSVCIHTIGNLVFVAGTSPLLCLSRRLLILDVQPTYNPLSFSLYKI